MNAKDPKRRRPLLLILLAACACKSEEFYRPEHAVDTRDAGTVHLAVLSVARWSDYVDALQPEFSLTAEQALDRVLYDSRMETEVSTDAVSVGASVATDSQDGVLGVEKPTTPAVTTITGPPALPSWEGKARDAGPDSMLRYAAATALFQEVQILNRYLRDAAVPIGHRPYLVRLQVSLMPKRRHAPYDAYTTLSFFAGEVRGNEQGGTPMPNGDSGTRSASTGSTGPPPITLRDIDMRRDIDMGGQAVASGPKVLPLLVTDNLESSLKSRSASEIRAIGLDLLSMWKSAGLSMGLDSVSSESSGQVYGRDMNALLTVARVSDNTLRVRLGAMQESTANYAMVPRSHNITLLVSVPEGARGTIDVVAKTVLVDTDTGEELAATTDVAIDGLMAKVSADHDLDKLAPGELDRLLQLAQANDQNAFFEFLAMRLDEDHPARVHAHSLWIDLVSLMAGGQFTSTRFDLPGHESIGAVEDRGFFEQTAVLMDDGIVTTLVLHGADVPDFFEVGATLEVFLPDGTPEGRQAFLAAEEVVVQRHARRTLFQFPSLEAWGMTGEGFEPDRVVALLLWGGLEYRLDTVYLARNEKDQ